MTFASCGHNVYWTGIYGTCMACRAEKAESDLAAMTKERDEWKKCAEARDVVAADSDRILMLQLAAAESELAALKSRREAERAVVEAAIFRACSCRGCIGEEPGVECWNECDICRQPALKAVVLRLAASRLTAALPAPEAAPSEHEHDFCIPVWKPMPGTAPGFEQQNYCANYRCECGALRFDDAAPSTPKEPEPCGECGWGPLDHLDGICLSKVKAVKREPGQ